MPAFAQLTRGVRQDHDDALRFVVTAGVRRLGGTAALGSLPPRRANLRSASRSTSAFNASRKTTERSLTPIALLADSRKSSSSVTVVRTRNSPKKLGSTYVTHCIVLRSHDAVRRENTAEPNVSVAVPANGDGLRGRPLRSVIRKGMD